MITEELRDVLSTYGHADTDITGLTPLLHGSELPAPLGSFHDDLAAAIVTGGLTSEVIYAFTGREFDDQAAVDHWLHRAWAIWFPGEGYPRRLGSSDRSTRSSAPQ